MFGGGGYLVEGMDARCPRLSRFYQLFDSDLVDDSETQEERDAARGISTHS